MLAHLIHYKGKGWLVPALPLAAGIVMFIAFDPLNLNEAYILPIALLFSSLFMWFYDKGPHLLTYGIKNTPKSGNTFMFIAIKYWAIAMGLGGCVLLGRLIGK